MTAIVGTNGAGKSTLVKLAAGLVAPTQGSLQAVAEAGEEFPLATYVKSVLFQDPGHFPFTIRHNVTMRFDRVAGERQIFALLTHLAQDKIILFTTHRYDTIRRAGAIVVLVDGRIAEVGAPEELERKAGAFWSLYFGQGSQLEV